MSVSLHHAASSTEEQISTIQESDPYDAHLTRSSVPNATRSMTEQETIRHSLHKHQSQQPLSNPSLLMWPTIGGTPINEFTTEGYFTCAFPTLFPTGAADFLGLRQNQLTIGNYFKHLMMYDDGCFAKHPRFRFFALNTEMRWRALQTGRVNVKQHPDDHPSVVLGCGERRTIVYAVKIPLMISTKYHL